MKCRCTKAYPYTASNSNDCCDSDPNVKPGQGNYFVSKSKCGTWDYNCNGSIEYRWNKNQKFVCKWKPFECYASPQGWKNAPVECGVTEQWCTDCNWGTTSCSELVCSSRKQACR